jgi:hypothetical protein
MLTSVVPQRGFETNINGLPFAVQTTSLATLHTPPRRDGIPSPQGGEGTEG